MLVGRMHVSLVFVFDKSVASGFSGFLVVHDVDPFDRTIDFKLTTQLGFCGVIIDSSHKQGLKCISLCISIIVWVP